MLTDEEMNTLCIDRGIEINDLDRIEKIKDFKTWVLYSDKNHFKTDVILI